MVQCKAYFDIYFNWTV